MSVPPSNRRSSSSPSSKGRPDHDHENKKDFKIPDKKLSPKQEDESKKKNLFDLAGQDLALKEKMQQNIAEELKTENIAAGRLDAVQAQAQVTQIGKIISQMVETMRIGQIDGKNMASLDLKKTPEVPLAFAGSNLTVSYQANGLTIHFDNFMTPQQQNTAITLIEKNKEQLEQMMINLQARNLQVTELSIGSHTISLPRIQPLPPPFQTPPSAEAETQRDRGGQEDRGREGEGEPH